MLDISQEVSMRFRDSHDKDTQILNIHEGHRIRLRKRLEECNFSNIDDYQCLEYILTLCVKRKDTNELAHTLINTFGSLANVLEASIYDLQTVKGITYPMAYFLHFLPQIFRNYKISKRKAKPILTCPQDIFNYLGECIHHLPNEEFYLICLDNSNKVICKKAIANGGNSQVAIDTRDIVKFAVKSRANKVILLHNHPTASCEPSEEDIEITKRLFFAFDIDGIYLSDHMIVNNEEKFYSFAHAGLIEKFENDSKSIFNEKSETI